MKIRVITLIASFTLMINSSLAQWEWQSPIPQGNVLYKTQFTNSMEGWAVGGYGTLLHTTDGGLSWTEQEYGRTDDLIAFKMITEITGWAVGDNGTILHTTNGGDEWVEQISGTTEGLNGLFFIDSQNGWIVGDKELILHTTNGGTTWQFQQYPATQYSINTVTFISPTEGWAAGANRRIYHTTNSGSTWTYQMIGPSMTSYLNVYFADALSGFITGTDGAIMRTTDGGTTWSQVSTGDNVNYNQIIMQNSLVGWIVGDGGRILRTLNGGASWSTSTLSEGMDLNGITRYSGSGTLWMVGEFGRILRSTNNGLSWSNLDSGSRLSVNWIDFSSETNGIAVGQTGLIMRTTDGGMSWSQSYSPTPTISMFGIDMVDDVNAWAVGDVGTILHTTDAVTWSAQSNPASDKILFGVSFPDVQNGWVAGGEFITNTGVILRTTNSGNNWNNQLNTSSVLFGICFKDILNGWAVGGNGTILHTTNGGNNWISQTSGVTTALYWCSFFNPLNGWIAGDGGTILHTTDGGNLWTPQNSGVTTNLYSVITEGISKATIIGDQGTILRTTDGGTTWQKEFSRTDIDLFGIANSTNTWVCGDYGTILKYNAPPVYGFVTGRIINDLNNNGSPDFDEPGMAGWKVQIAGPETLQTYSLSDGSFTFSDVTLGVYTLTQEVLPGWSQTMPASPGGYGFTLTKTETDFNGIFCDYTSSITALNVQSGWNLLSFPIQVENKLITSIFPSAQSGAFLYINSYTPVDSVPDGLGCWIKFPATTTLWIAGTPIPSDTLPIYTGWNIIGSISDSIDTSFVITMPPTAITSDYYGYGQSYEVSKFIKPGKGYWVKSAYDGIMILKSGISLLTTAKDAEKSALDNLNILRITDASGRSSILYFGSDESGSIDPHHYELPPLPPEGSFDVRYKNGGSVHLFTDNSENQTSINLHSLQYPVKISWDIKDTDHESYEIINSAKENKNIFQLSGSGNFILESDKGNTITLTKLNNKEPINIPTEYALMQNSPNPFNPTTKLSYAIGHLSFVKLFIINILGEKVATLVNEVKQPGVYDIIWNAGDYPSGVYYYRLEADAADQSGKQFAATKKMILLK
jgi:photosystem II stability/assembly factor-like uncharacterized protein